jgi:glycyl-tRNA synthetase beta chain
MSDLLFEIGTEELPAGFIRPALSQMRSLAESALMEARIGFESVQVMGTPRRLVLSANGVAPGQEDRVTEHKGPPARVAFDADRRPTQAAVGFARKCGVDPEELVEREGYIYASVLEKGRSTVEVAAEILPQMVRSLSFPKSMRWGSGELRFGRPIRWLVALFGGDLIPFQLDGLESGRMTYGHRFLSPDPKKVPDAASYAAIIGTSFVLVDDVKRQEVVKEQVEAMAAEVGGEVPWDEVRGLAEEVTCMIEYPTAFVGSFESRFLELPRRILVEVMRKHQQYFPLTRKAAGRALMPHFIAVRNGDKRSLETVRRGNEKVLRARFADAAFFFEQDTRTRLSEKLGSLSDVVYQHRLGTMLDKAKRLEGLSRWIAQKLQMKAADCENAARAGLLCKADLVTQMVTELPSLQGAVGAEYALLDGENETVAGPIGEQYSLDPKTELGKVLVLADKTDTLCSHFGIGLQPTGSSDPYALRRAAGSATGVLAHKVLSLSDLLDEGLRLLAEQGFASGDTQATKAQVTEYFAERLAAILAERRVRYDVSDAVLAAGFDLFPDAIARAAVIERRRRQDPDFLATTMAATRVVNILRHAQSKGVVFGSDLPDASRYTEAQETALADARARAVERIGGLGRGTAQAELERRYEAVFEILAALRETIDDYFDKVMVMTDDARLRANRLRFLAQLNASFLELCDFSKIVQDAP